MAKAITKLQVLIAYPDDVANERAVLDTVVNELNATWSKTLGLQLELIDWKTHSWPNFGTDAQAVINEELGDDYDIFIGIMWTRFGEPTPRAESGTAEEFNIALNRFRNDPARLRIMFYFKSAPPASLNELDPQQLILIRDFKERVDREGGLYSEFKDLDQFASAVRMHLSRQAQEWGKTWGTSVVGAEDTSSLPVLSPNAVDTGESNNQEEDEGFLDLIERSQESFETLNEIVSRMSSDMDTYTKRLAERKKDLDELNEANADIKQRKRAINSTAEILDQYSSGLETELPRFSSAYSSALNSMARAVSIWSEDQMEGVEEARGAYEQVQNLSNGLTAYRDALVSTRGAVAGIARATSVFNRSKRRMLSVLDALIAEIDRGITLTKQVEDQFQGILRQRDSAHKASGS